jgi:hypothetical protein
MGSCQRNETDEDGDGGLQTDMIEQKRSDERYSYSSEEGRFDGVSNV